MSWSVATARSHLSKVIAAAGDEAQVIDNRGEAVAVVVSIEAWREFERWRRDHRAPTMSEAIEEIRRICTEEGYELAPTPREARGDAFAEALDGVDR
ncbi:MAG: type II toxin-antitoxin system Phd/YefM family antitoxin [Deltaproteobacteria bacterium]|nr:type II toxin-antitoxin system Phd/YefM family antitoxin [Deltaproteobacteria bacterium]